jgi:hypothetical protein
MEGAIAPSSFKIHELEPTSRPTQARFSRMKQKTELKIEYLNSSVQSQTPAEDDLTVQMHRHGSEIKSLSTLRMHDQGGLTSFLNRIHCKSGIGLI